MSVIFKTLRKLRGQSLEGEKGAKKLKRSRNIYSFRRILFSPLGILFLTIFIFLSGMATLYGIRYLKDYLEQKSKDSFLVGRERTEAVKTEIKEEREELAVPPPPKAIPVEEARPGRLYLPSTSKKESPAKEIHTVRYIPPRFLKEPKEQAKKITPVGAPRESPVHQKETSKAPTYTPARPTRLLSKRSVISHASPSDTLKIKASPEPGTTDLPPLAPDINKSDRVKASPVELPPKALSKLASKEILVPPQAKQSPKEPIKPKEATETEDENIHLANVEKSARIASLVMKIQRSMSTGNSDQTEDLINQLASVKGEENSYVLKLRAFWYLCQDDHESATSLLNKVLSKNENDLEAGLNMAILEIKANNLIEARERLNRLRKIYPENTLITELIQKLR